MSETIDQQPAGATPAPTPKEVAATVESWDDFAEAVGGLSPTDAAKAVLEAKRWEQRAKQNDPKRVAELEHKAQQFDALSAASQTELERAQAQAQALQSELETTQRTALITSVALDKGLPPNLARRLQGDSREDLEADADELLSTFGNTNGATRTPAPDPSQGSSAKGGAAGTPAQQFASLISQMPG